MVAKKGKKQDHGKYYKISGPDLTKVCCVNGVINWDCGYILMTGHESKLDKVYYKNLRPLFGSEIHVHHQKKLENIIEIK